MKRFQLLVTLVCLTIPRPGVARLDSQACGTHALTTSEELFLHRKFAASRRTGYTLSASTNRDIGQVAILEDSNGVVGRRNPFDLNRKTVSFAPGNTASSSYSFSVSDTSYDATAASAGQRLSLTDDDTRSVALPFPFPYFGSTYQQVFVNSDGNLTFASGDLSSADRSLGRFTAGPPRIAPLFSDLDPSVSFQGIRVTAESGKFTVTWVSVPAYSATGTSSGQTFQVRLYPSGRIELTWDNISLTDAVVGISPGNLQGSGSVLSFLAGSNQQFTSAIAERYSASDAVDVVTAAQKFYETHDDAYDYLVFFNGEGIQAAPGAVAYEVTVRNSRSGYGDTLVNDGLEYGSSRRLQSVLNLGPLTQYPLNPNSVVPSRGTTGDTTLTVLGHEAGHLFLAFASVRDPKDPQAQPMLGRSLVHWSFLFNSEASLLEGNRIQDLGPDSIKRFATVATVQGYAPLDQYLMGFRAAEEVPPTFLVTNSPDVSNAARAPQVGVAFNGDRRDIAIQEVIDVVGRRTPDFTVAQRQFRFAFILIIPTGSAPDASQVAQVETYRSSFTAAYSKFTSGRATADTTIKRAVQLSAYPAAGVLAGGSASGSITLDSPTSASLTILLRPSTGLISTPPSVTIPAGASTAQFAINGIRAGVDQLTAEPADLSYESATANIQVADSPASLKLAAMSGDKQVAIAGQLLPLPIVFKLTDINDVPYPGVRILATITGGGTAESSVLTDLSGLATFNWIPGSGPLNQLTASLTSGPTATVNALGLPGISTASFVNAASFAPGLSPGSIATVFGTNLIGANIAVNGMATHVFYADTAQANFLVPADIPITPASVTVTNVAGSATATQVPVVQLQPGIFAALNLGSYIQIYATGLGPLNGQVTVNNPRVLVGGLEATVLYSGLAPGFSGLYQVNASLPKGVVGPVPVSLTLGGTDSNTVNLR